MKKIISYLNNYIKAYKFILVFTLKTGGFLYILNSFIKLIINLVPLASALIWARIVDEFLLPKSENFFENAIVYYFLAFIALLFVRALLSHLSSYLGHIVSRRVSHGVEMLEIEKMSNISTAYLENPNNLDAIKVAEKNGRYVTLGANSLTNTVSALISFIASLFVFLSSSPVSGLIFLMTCIPGCILTYNSQKKFDSFDFEHIAESRKRDYYREILTNRKYAKELRAYNLAGHFMRKFNDILHDLKVRMRQIYELGLGKIFLGEMLTYASILAFVLFFTWRVIGGHMLPGAFTLYIGLMLSMKDQIKGTFVDEIAFELDFHVPHILQFRDFLEAEDDVKDTGTLDFPEMPEIEFSNVTFYYPGASKPALDNVSFCIKGGEKIAIVGINGAGKSTIIKLILRLYEVQSGKILINGQDIREYKLESLRSAFGVCFQDVSEYSLSLKESIALGDIYSPINEERIMQSLEISGMEKYTDYLSSPLTRNFSSEGLEFSGGEWQKIALSRVFYGKNKYIILDEPTSALDVTSEHQIFESFKTLCKARGGILISHHLSATMSVDKILVLDGGKLIEFGTHTDLINANGHYAMLYKLQADKFRQRGAVS